MLFKGPLSRQKLCLIKLPVGRAYFQVLYEAHVYRAEAWQHSNRHVPLRMLSCADTGQAIDSGPYVPLVPVLPQGWQRHYKQGACQLQEALFCCGMDMPKRRGMAKIFEGYPVPVKDLVRQSHYQSHSPMCVEAWHELAGQLHSARQLSS